MLSGVNWSHHEIVLEQKLPRNKRLIDKSSERKAKNRFLSVLWALRELQHSITWGHPANSTFMSLFPINQAWPTALRYRVVKLLWVNEGWAPEVSWLISRVAMWCKAPVDWKISGPSGKWAAWGIRSGHLLFQQAYVHLQPVCGQLAAASCTFPKRPLSSHNPRGFKTLKWNKTGCEALRAE